jgi:hypothetical protein
MREKHQGTQPLFVPSEFAERLAKDLNQCLQRGKHPIVQVFLAQFLPEMFDRIDFRAISGLKDQPDILWDLQIFGPVPARITRLA